MPSTGRSGGFFSAGVFAGSHPGGNRRLKAKVGKPQRERRGMDSGGPIARRVVPIFGRTLRSLPIVESQHAAEPLAAWNSANIRRLTSCPFDQPVVETLGIAFEMIVGSKLRDDETKVPLAEWDDLRQALRFDWPDEPSRVSVQIRTANRKLHCLHTTSAHNAPELRGEERIAAVTDTGHFAGNPHPRLPGSGPSASSSRHPD